MSAEALFTAEAVRERFDLDWETDYNFATKEEFLRVKWRDKGTRKRWHKVAVFKSAVHPTLGDLAVNRAEYVAAWLNMRGVTPASAPAEKETR
jgi:hypothetical protein